MAKKVIGQIKLQVLAGQANPSPPVGPALGQHGVNIMEFVKQFNARTQDLMKEGAKVPVIITVYADRSFTFITKTPPVSFFIKKAAGIPKGSAEAKYKTAGKITVSQAREIAEKKMPDLNCTDVDAAEKIVRGSARSMGIDVVEG